MSKHKVWNETQIYTASRASFVQLLNAGYEIENLVLNAEKYGDIPYLEDVRSLQNAVSKMAVDFNEEKTIERDAIIEISDLIDRISAKARDLSDFVGMELIAKIEGYFLDGNEEYPSVKIKERRYSFKNKQKIDTMADKSPHVPETEEEAREMAIGSFNDLFDKMFSNINRDLDAGIRASKALSATGKICGQEEDHENGDYFVKMLESLKDGVAKMNVLYKDRMGMTEKITDEQWKAIDEAAEEE